MANGDKATLITMTADFYKKALQEAYKKGYADAMVEAITHKSAKFDGAEFKANIVDGETEDNERKDN